MIKIKIVDANTKQPATNRKVPFQIKGKDSGFMSLMTDHAGYVQLEDKYNGQQMTSPSGGGQPTWVTITNEATLFLTSKEKTTETSKK